MRNSANYTKKIKMMYFDKFWVYLFPGHPIGDVFDKWDGGEPNNGNDNEDCVVLKKHGKLHDYPCFFKFPFICKKSLVSVQWNGECNMTNLGIFFLRIKVCVCFSGQWG